MGSSSASNQQEPTLNGIWDELNKVLGGLDLNGSSPDAWSAQQELKQRKDEAEIRQQNVSI